MNVTYAGIKLLICHFNEVSQRTLSSEDGADYIGTHYIIDVTCIWNPFATASLNGLVQQPPPGTGGDFYAISIPTLRNTLMQKRQELILDINGTVLLHSPPNFNLAGAVTLAPCDVANGPNPISCDITAFHGTKTAIVRYRIETTINECPSPQSGILSNRWTMTEDVSPEFLSTLSVQGTAIFRADVMQLLKKVPDTFRGLFIAPCKAGFQRVGLQVAQSSDGRQVWYRYRDEQQIYQMLPQSGIVRCHGMTSMKLDWTGGKFGVAGLRLPDAYARVHAEVWGRPGTTRVSLANAAIQVLAASGVDITSRVGIQSEVTVDFPERHAVADVVGVTSGLIGGAFNLGAPALNQVPFSFQELNPPTLWVSLPAGGAIIPTIAPGGDGLHGDALILLLAQQLLTPCQAPPAPAQPLSITGT